MNRNMRDFIKAAREMGPEHYVELKKPVDPYLEIAVIQAKLAAQGKYPIIYCPEVEGSELPLVTNLIASFELAALGLGLDANRMTREEINNAVREKVATRMAPTWVPASEAPVKDVKLLEDKVDLSVLPIMQQSTLDAGKYIGSAVTIAKWPDTGEINSGIYRHMVMGKDLLGCMINPGNDGAYIARRYAELDQPMEVALVIGHNTAVIQSAQARQLVELDLMGGYMGEPLEVIRGETVDLPIPAGAEIVIEGVIDPKNMSTDGPYGEYFGYYGVGNKPCYVIQVTAITMRKDAIYHHLGYYGIPHEQTGVMIGSIALNDKLKGQFPTIKAVTSGWLGTYISLKQRVPGEGRQAGLLAVCENYGKTAVVVDDDVDVYNEREVMWAISTRMIADEDLLIMPGVKGAHLDPVSYSEDRDERGPMTTRLVIDATKPLEREFEIKNEPDQELMKILNLDDFVR